MRYLFLIIFCFVCHMGCVPKNVAVVDSNKPASSENIDSLTSSAPLPLIEDSSDVVDEQEQKEQDDILFAALDEEVSTSDPLELKSLLELEASVTGVETSVSRLRPKAIQDAAQLVALQTAMAWRYGQLIEQTERYSSVMDTIFNFLPLLMMQDDTLIMPPILTRGGASLRIEENEMATATVASFELLEPARFISVVPHWRIYLMMIDKFPEPEQPNPAVMPKNKKERAIWKLAVRKAWLQGIAEADQLYIENVLRMVRDYRGIMLYHLLTAQDLLSRVHSRC